MKNIQTSLKGTILTLTIDISKRYDLSSSGKSIIVASTEGNVGVEGSTEVKFGLNVYVKAPN